MRKILMLNPWGIRLSPIEGSRSTRELWLILLFCWRWFPLLLSSEINNMDFKVFCFFPTHHCCSDQALHVPRTRMGLGFEGVSRSSSVCLRWSSLWASNSYPVCASNSNSTGYTFPHTVELSDGAKYHHVNVVGCGFSDAPSSIELFVCRCCSLTQ